MDKYLGHGTPVPQERDLPSGDERIARLTRSRSGGSRLMTLKKAADELGCHVETLRRAIRSRELLVTRHPTLPGHPYMVSASDLATFVEKRRVS